MHILPCVDIKDGRAVRLYQGRADRETVYNDSPLDAARRWVDEGATFLHVVDLDGAFAGEAGGNEEHVLAIAREAPVPVQCGGGIRSLEKARRLVAGGVDRVVIGTRALEDRGFVDELVAELAGHVHVGIDARDGYVAVKGWTETSGVPAEELLASFRGSGLGAIVYTDISRDGALAGPNLPAMQRATEVTDVPLIASGGVTTVEHVRALAALPLFGIIIGKALYDGRLALAEARAAAGA
jgi:phosphoribosylformimino-5-aminoimidazole carboxamide ribotide isomerase